ncbi:unnamed protein product [Meloidogyne enterolobii]|uniref:Uncharacterized protein n=1 Tax=Meloidogyne enterolobii TaxID=390850 RepID=A0ACB1AT52_MELEN
MSIMGDSRKYEVFIPYMKKMRENNNKISNLEIHLHYNKHLEKNKNENVEIYDILIRRVETNDELFSNEVFKMVRVFTYAIVRLILLTKSGPKYCISWMY